MLEDGNSHIPFDVWHSQQKHIVMLKELTWCVNACEGVQTLHNQRHVEVSLGQLRQQPLR